MRIDNRNLRRTFSGPGCCEYCGRWSTIRHCAHVFATGLGGGHRLDIRINLVSLDWLCHRKSHDGDEPSQKTLLAIVAEREGTTPDAIVQEIYRLKRLPKETSRAEAGYPVARHTPRKGSDALQGDPLAAGPFRCVARLEIDQGGE